VRAQIQVNNGMNDGTTARMRAQVEANEDTRDGERGSMRMRVWVRVNESVGGVRAR